MRHFANLSQLDIIDQRTGGGEFGGCCINATLRDYGRIGLFALNDGKLSDGTRVLPEGWMDESIAPSKGYDGYGYFWWLTAPGMPPVDVGAYYDGTSAALSGDLARKWHLCDVLGVGTPDRPPGAAKSDVEGFDSTRVDHFLLSLLEYRGGTHPLSLAVVKSLEELYGLGAYKNSEIRCKWLQLRLGAGDETAFEDAADMLRGMGRMKFLRPLYRSLRLCKGGGKEFAEKLFQETRGMYHPIAEKMVAADLGL